MLECNCKAFNTDFEFQHENRKVVTFKDKGSATYKYPNKDNNHLAKYRVDGGLIADKGKKCDYLLLNCERKSSYFIELKGSDISHAIDQIERSIDELKKNLPNFSVFARIVLTRVNTTHLIDCKLKKLEKKVELLNGNLMKSSGSFEEPV